MSALMAGPSIPVIQALGRCRSDSFWRYLEAPNCFLAQQMANMVPVAPGGSTFWPEIQQWPYLGQ